MARAASTWLSLIFAASALAFAVRPAAAAPPPPVDDVEGAYRASAMERDLGRLLAARAETPAFVYHFRPGGLAESARAGLDEKIAPAWRRICERLELKNPQKVHVFLYDTAAEMGRLTGRTSLEAIAVGGALHLPADRPVFGAALVKLAEPAWGRAGDRLGGGLEGGRWYKVRAVCKSGKVEVSVDERKLSAAPVPSQPGAIGFGIEEGRLGIRALKVRALPAEADAPVPAFTYALRGDATATWQPDVPGRWKVSDEELEGVKYGRMSRTRFPLEARDVEVECELRVSEGSTAEIALHAGPSSATRIVFGPGSVYVDAPGVGRRQITGPHLTMREGLAEALSAELDATPIHLFARVLLERGLAPSRDLPRLGFPSGTTERWRRSMLVGSFVLDLFERHGHAKYREAHFLDLILTTKTPLGELADLEAEWRKRLVERSFDAAELKSAARRLGVDVLADPSAWRDIATGTLRTEVVSSGGAFSTAVAGELAWAGQTDDSRGRATAGEPASRPNAAVRATIRLGEGSRIRILVKAADGKASGALFSASGAHLVTPDNMVAKKSARGLEAGRWYEVAVVLEGGGGRIYVDGELVADAESGAGLSGGPGRILLECEGRRGDLKSISTRGLD